MASSINASVSGAGGVITTADNTGILQLQTAGTTAITVSASQNTTFAGTVTLPTGTLYPLVAGTAVASTSGTSIDFTSIPSWVKRVTLCFSGVSANGSSIVIVQIGSGSVTTSGYSGSAGGSNNASGNSVANFTTGFGTVDTGNASIALHGSMTITLMNSSSNLWCASGSFGSPSITTAYWMGGTGAISGVLDRVRITTVNGTDAFDAGSINILYE
jgi:hypothetical protein